MGGFFSPPKLPPPPPPTPAGPDPAEDERKRRLQSIERRRRGRTGTIATSDRGFLSPGARGAQSGASKKTLLGE
jgi:hypothetical protein